MMKILPLLIIPLFFLIVYLGVENLTQNNLNYVVSDSQKKEDSNSENSNKLIVSENDKMVVFEDNAPEEKSKTKEKNLSVVDKSTSEETLSKSQNVTVENKLTKVEKKIDEIKKADNFIIQFGAFSRKDYAENSKKDIEEKINKKFNNVALKVDFEKSKKLYKLLLKTKDENLAKSICEFSKKININCLIRK